MFVQYLETSICFLSAPLLSRQEALTMFGSKVDPDRSFLVPLSRCADVSDGWEELLTLKHDVIQQTKVNINATGSNGKVPPDDRVQS